MTGYNEKNNCLYVENISLEQIAKEVGTPTYVYSTENIRNQYEKLQNTMRNVLPADHQPMLCYACKANSNIAILSYLHSLGSNLEIVSKGELHRGLKAGFDPREIADGYEERGSLGMVNMRERAEIVNGLLKIDSRNGRGTSVRLAVPLTPEAADRARRPGFTF